MGERTSAGTRVDYLIEIPKHDCGGLLDTYYGFHFENVKFKDSDLRYNLVLYQCRKCGDYLVMGKRFTKEQKSELEEFLSSVTWEQWAKSIKTSSTPK